MRESARIENSKTTKKSDSTVNHYLNKGKDLSSCGSCSACKSLHSPQMSSQSASSALSYAKAMGKESCAALFMQRNYGNRFTSSALSRPSTVSSLPSIQKKCSCGGSCSKCKGEEEAEKISMSIMKMSKPSAISYQPSANNDEQTQISEIMSSKGLGHGLDDNTRSFMGERLGYDFSHVRLHNDTYAARKSNELNAEAFTIGRDVFFNAGRYKPSSGEGKKLLSHELTHVVQQSHQLQIQRLGANPGCTADERTTIHQAIYNARGWLNKAIPKLEASPLSAAVIASLRRNFGPTYGVAVNAPLIVGRLRTAYGEISSIPFGCDGVADASCAANHCGHSYAAGSHRALICRNVTLTPGRAWQFQAGCVLHESFHAAFTGFTAVRDSYSGWHGFSGSTPGYPGVGTDPLLNADSYTTLVMDLS